MMGMKERIFSPLPREASLEELVPVVNFYRRLKDRPFFAGPYAFTDMEGRCGALFLASRWVFTPMACAIHNDRLLCAVFTKAVKRRCLMKIPFVVVVHPTQRAGAAR